jgi:tetratricopeptide (TPR) repeat protein
MTENQPTERRADIEDNVADRNVERLLAEAYRPEVPDSDFVARTTAAMQQAATEFSSARAPGRRGRLTWRLVRWSVAATLLVAAGAVLGALWLAKPGYEREGSLVWINGKPYRPADSGLSQMPWRGLPVEKSADDDDDPESLVGSTGLTARARGQSAAPPVLAVGESLSTGGGERLRVALTDGSTLYLNQNTTVTLSGRRRLSLEDGEVYVEVQSAGSEGAEGEPTEQDRFVLATPDRRITALGTKFNARVSSDGTQVFVAQGKVAVTGIELPLLAGQQLGVPGAADSEPTVGPAPRATHLLAWTRELMAEAESPLVPESEYTGGALIAVDPYGQEAKLSLRKYHVDVHIEDGFARTTIDQTYFNHEPWRMEGTFYFPLPPDASLSRLAMYVSGKLMEGGMAERDYARQVFETIVHRQKDPALLEWVDGSTFKMRVFPLEGRQEKRIVLSYTQKLASLYDRTDYRFPGGHNMQMVGEWSARVRVAGGAKLNWESTSHDFDVSRDDGDLVLEASAEKIRPDRDVALTLRGSTDEAGLVPARFVTCVHEGSQYLALRWRPELPSQKRRERRDWIFLFEASGDRDPLVARVQVDVIRTLLDNAEHNDTFSILTAGTRVHAYAAKPKKVTPKNVAGAVRFLEQTQLVGALDLERALATTGPFVSAADSPVLVHLGSGVPVLGNKEVDVLVEKVPKAARYVGVGVGKRWSRAFMKEAAARSGGYVTQINPDEHVGWRALELLSTLNTPRLLNVAVVDRGERFQFLPDNDSLASGEALCAITRFDDGTELPERVEVTGLLDGELYTDEIPVTGVRQHADYLPRTWAKLQIDRWMADGAQKNKATIVELSKAMYVMSPFTSLLVLESEEMYRQFNVDRGRKDHWAMYPCPDEIPVVYEPDPNRPMVNLPDSTGQEKPTVAQVLATVTVHIPPDILYWPNYPQRYNAQMVPVLHLYSGQYAAQYGYQGGGYGHASWRERDSRWRFNQWSVRNELIPVGHGIDVDGDSESDEEGGWSDHDMLLDDDPASFSMGQDRADLSAFRHSSFGVSAGSGPVVTAAPQASMPPVGGPRDSSDRFLQAFDGRSRGPMKKLKNLPSVNRLFSNGRDVLSDLQISSGSRKYAAGDGFLFDPNRMGLSVIRDTDEEEVEKSQVDKSRSEFWAVDRISRRIHQGGYHRYTYQPPQFNGNWCVFYDLVGYAPGLNTNAADVRAVIEAEAQPNPRFAPGRIDQRAAELIRKARRGGWHKATIRDEEDGAVMTVEFDGTGRHRYEQLVGHGIRERVLCDGAHLWHIYDELGLGAERQLSRFHRRELTRLIPWALPPAEDLARGADLLTVDKHTIAIVPRAADAVKDDEGKPVSYRRWHLVFHTDGPLAERRLVEMPSGKIIVRQTYGSDGTVKVIKGDDELVTEWTVELEPCGAPSLEPDHKRLVILPMPIRERNWLFQKHKLSQKSTYKQWTDDEAMALLAADLPGNQWEANQIITEKYFESGDRRIGFYTLLISGGHSWDRQQKQQLGRVTVHMDPLEDHPQEPLAEYVATYLQMKRSGSPDNLKPVSGPPDGFVQRLAEFRDIWMRYNSGRANQGDEANRRRERERALRFVRESLSPEFGWAILSLIRNYGGDQEFYRAAGEAALAFENIPSLSYTARYEHARGLCRSGDWEQARKLFDKLWKDTIENGFLPRFDHEMRNAFHNSEKGSQKWQELVRGTATDLIDSGDRAAAIRLAWHVHYVGDRPMAEEIVGAAVSTVPHEERLNAILAAVEYFWYTGQHPRADTMLMPLLDDKEYAKWPSLWRLAGQTAETRGMTARALRYIEQAMELEYENLPDVVNLQMIRQDYGQLLARYQQLAAAIATMEAKPPRAFLARVIGAADRWRAIDPDPTTACQSAARIFGDLGATELAWDYLTTPLAARPNESAPWVSVAQMLRQQGHLELADRAYASAFEAEATNAQILWDRAQVLLEAGRTEDAKTLLRQVADGEWPPQFGWIQRQAKQYVESK